MTKTMNEDQIVQLPLNDLHPFPNHPFKVVDDERMAETVSSINAYGVLAPIIVRPAESGGYEIISGHRRKHACELLGLDTMPAIIRDLTDEEAVILMADSNLQRENILPSERAYAYKMKLEAVKRLGGRPANNVRQVGAHFRSDEIAAEGSGESGRTIRRFIRLTYLIPQLLNMVDEKKVAFNPAVELSQLHPDEQIMLVNALERAQCSPSLSQAQRMKNLSREGKLTEEAIDGILAEEKQQPLDRIAFDRKTFAEFFPKSYSSEQMEKTIVRLLSAWQKKREKGQER